MITAIYLIQIFLLCACVNMTWQARHAMHGMSFGWMALLIFLIIRRFDDMNRNPDDIGILVLSSVIVVIVTYETYNIYRNREAYALWQARRRARENELEATRERSEQLAGKSWDYK